MRPARRRWTVSSSAWRKIMSQKPTPILCATLAAALLAASPAAAADRMVPQDAKGPLIRFKGQEWFKVLTYCSAVYSEEASVLKAAGDTAKADQSRMAGASFMSDRKSVV